jgi:D-cysteine desulfhydrase
VLSGAPVDKYEGNLFLDKLMGAEIESVSANEYEQQKTELMERKRQEMEQRGLRPYVIPAGASNGVGAFGYYTAFEEIMQQEKELSLHFDCIVVATGSCGTYAGLFLAKTILRSDTKLYGISVSDSAQNCGTKIRKIVDESAHYLHTDLDYSAENINIIDGYVGKGYGLSKQEEITFITDFARKEGIILDPVYTGKAMYGLASEIEKGSFDTFRNILFIHTGGIFDIFAFKELFE